MASSGGNRRAVCQRDRHPGLAGFDRAGFTLDAQKRRQLRRARFECRDQMPVLDIAAECAEADLGRRKINRRRADQACSRVDDAHDAKRSGEIGAAVPGAEGLQRGDGAREKGGRAVVDHGTRRDQGGLDAGRGQRNRGGEPGRAPADNRHFHG